ncbi:MAG: YgiW/YdeI family stress tolerance OB fold protein [Deltaproteobacteria bacterium]|jgi:uncharacterized protein (TIGR00156 family)|nr:YgiW/YdeI family stress tolerance OB fold protein [Deltaproteobacteria bacterium]
MKSTIAILIAVFAILLVSPQVTLAQGGLQAPAATDAKLGGGFTGPGVETTSVAEALRQKDDTQVILTGQIVRHLGKDNYLFKDSSGEITIDIDDTVWKGLNVTPNDTVEIRGEIDKDWTSVEVDVDFISKVN